MKLKPVQVAGGIAAVIAVLSIGTFLYLTRDIAAPSASVQDAAQQLDTADTVATADAAANSAANSAATVYRISQDDSQVTYSLYELLNGADKTVIGTTNQVAGDVRLNLSNLSQTEVGAISINARTFATDESRRDNAVARFVLQSENAANEFITFQPTSISGLPESAAVGETLSFQIAGDLTIAGTTRSVTFDVTAALDSGNRLTRHAEATVQRSTFQLNIPDVPFVANVGEDVTLKLDFVAAAVTDGDSGA